MGSLDKYVGVEAVAVGFMSYLIRLAKVVSGEIPFFCVAVPNGLGYVRKMFNEEHKKGSEQSDVGNHPILLLDNKLKHGGVPRLPNPKLLQATIRSLHRFRPLQNLQLSNHLRLDHHHLSPHPLKPKPRRSQPRPKALFFPKFKNPIFE